VKPFNVISVSEFECGTMTHKPMSLYCWTAGQFCWFTASGRLLSLLGQLFWGENYFWLGTLVTVNIMNVEELYF